MYRELFQLLTGTTHDAVSATLYGYHRYALEKKGWPRIPAIAKAKQSSVQGILVRTIDERSMELLDDFEDVAAGLYVKEEVRVTDNAGRETDATVYIAGPEAVEYLSGVWNPEAFLERHYADYRDRIIPRFLNER